MTVQVNQLDVFDYLVSKWRGGAVPQHVLHQLLYTAIEYARFEFLKRIEPLVDLTTVPPRSYAHSSLMHTAVVSCHLPVSSSLVHSCTR